MKEKLAWEVYNFINDWKNGKFGETSLQEALDKNAEFDFAAPIIAGAGERIIPFKELLDLVAHVDYLFHESFPIRFKVKNKEETINYECGIGICDENVRNDLVDGEPEAQYLIRLEDKGKGFSVLLVQNPDDMYYEEIEKDLKEKCNITDDSLIIIEDKNSFNGEEPYFFFGSNKELLLIYDPDEHDYEDDES